MEMKEINKLLLGEGAPFELTCEGENCNRQFVTGPKTLRQLFATTRSNETAFVYQDERYTFEDLYLAASSIGAWLVDDQGLQKGDRVAIAMRNYPEWVAAFTAVTSIGCVVVAVNAHWEGAELAYALNHSGAKVVFADEERVAGILQCELDHPPTLVGVRCEDMLDGAVVPYAEVISTIAHMPDISVGPQDDATILYTSGSTGLPKGAVSTHQNILSALQSWEYEMHVWLLQNSPRNKPDTSANPDVPANPDIPVNKEKAPAPQPAILLGIPLFHVNGLHAVLLLSYRQQRKVVSMYKWEPADAVKLIQAEHIASFVAPATMTGDLVTYAREHGEDMPSLNVVGGGGAARPSKQVSEISETFKKAIPNTGWGMTETNAIGTGISGMDYVGRPNSSGRPHLVVDLAIIDENGERLPANQQGELLVRGTSVISGYWNNPQANDESFVDGWFRTGDIAYLDDDGFLYIVDRLKQLIIRGGENVGCGEVEDALLEFEGVVEAVVYGVPDERLGEEVAATVYCNGEISEEEIRAFLETNLAKFKVPRYVRTVGSPLPRLASGKFDRVSLQNIHQSEIEAAQPHL